MVKNKKTHRKQDTKHKERKTSDPQKFQLLDLSNMDYNSVFEVFKETREYMKNKG